MLQEQRSAAKYTLRCVMSTVIPAASKCHGPTATSVIVVPSASLRSSSKAGIQATKFSVNPSVDTQAMFDPTHQNEIHQTKESPVPRT